MVSFLFILLGIIYGILAFDDYSLQHALDQSRQTMNALATRLDISE